MRDHPCGILVNELLHAEQTLIKINWVAIVQHLLKDLQHVIIIYSM